MSADLLTEMERHLAMLDQLYEEDVQAQMLDASSFAAVPSNSIKAPPTSGPSYTLIASPVPWRNVKPTAKLSHLPIETLLNILTWIKADPGPSKERDEDEDPYYESGVFETSYTNILLSLMTTSAAFNHVAGMELYSRLSFLDTNRGALEIKSSKKLEYLSHSQKLSINTHCTWECSGQDFAKQKVPPIKVRNMHLRLNGLSRNDNHHKNEVCNPFTCLLSRRLLPQTLVLWMTHTPFMSCPWNVAAADNFYPYQMDTLVVHLGKPGDWVDAVNNLNQDTWFRPFVRTKSVVFMIDDNNNYTHPKDLDEYDWDMRYNPKDNLHPWISRLTESLIEFCLDPNYAKDITIVNMGVVRSDKLGLKDKWTKSPALCFCERCFAENEYKELFQTKYDTAFEEHTQQGGNKVEKASIKFIPMLEYLNTRDWKDHLAYNGEAAYLRPDFEEINWTQWRSLEAVLCPKCGHANFVDVSLFPYIFDPPVWLRIQSRGRRCQEQDLGAK